MSKKSGIDTANLAFCGLFAALIAVGAFLKVMLPIGVFEVTFSLQFLFALLAGLLLGRRSGLTSVLVYLAVGLAGIPVFAHGGGLAYLLRPTFGFLIGFAAAAYVAGLVMERSGTASRRGADGSAFSGYPSLPRLFLAALCGELAYYACGLFYYYLVFNFALTNGQTIGVRELLVVWFLSTAFPDSLLAVCAALLSHRLIPVLAKVLGR